MATITQEMVEKVYTQTFSDVSNEIKTKGRTCFDRKLENKYTKGVPSDLKDDDILTKAVICLLANRAMWEIDQYHSHESKCVHNEIFNDTLRYIYKNANSNDLLAFAKLSD